MVEDEDEDEKAIPNTASVGYGQKLIVGSGKPYLEMYSRITRKYLLRRYILGVLTHTTAWGPTLGKL